MLAPTRRLYDQLVVLRRIVRRLNTDIAHVRRAAVVGVATAWLLLNLLPRQQDGQVIVLSDRPRSEPRQVVVPVDAPQTHRLRQRAGRLAAPVQGRMPTAYYRARWRYEAASHYINEVRLRCEADEQRAGQASRRPFGRPPAVGSVTTVSFEVATTGGAGGPATPYGIAYWQSQRDAAQREVQQLLTAAAAAAKLPLGIRLGPIRPGGPLPGSALFALAAGSLAAMIYGVRRRRPLRLLCQADCRLEVPAGWIRVKRSARQQVRRWIDRGAWLVIAACALQACR